MVALNTPTYMRLREQLRADIVSGIWALGSHVTLAELSAHYQVSTNPVREALLQLQGEGVVSMRMNRGAVVPVVDEKYIDDLYRLRGAIQVMLARDAACNATPDQVAQMMAHCKAYEQAALADDIGESVKANRLLHECVDSISGNLMALQLLDGRSSLVDAFRRRVGYGAGRQQVVAQQHRKIVNAIAAGDQVAAAQASLEHTDSARVDLVAACRAAQSVGTVH
jgi:DNA-binding GntR family transcriptional regulator